MRHQRIVCSLAVLSFFFLSTGRTEEPAELFLTKLREAGYYDMALAYLDRVAQGSLGTPDMQTTVDLERGQTLLDKAPRTRTADERNATFDAAEAALQSFLKEHPNHDRAAEARLQLANLQLVKGAQLLATENPTADDRAAARQSYAAAVETFEAITDNLREKLKEMQGQKIDSSDSEAVQLRERLRGQFLRALSMGGLAQLRVAETYPPSEAARKEPLNKAIERFTELSEKYGRYVVAAKAMLYRGQAQEQLGDRAAALDSYLRMLEQPDLESLRDAKTEAVVGAMRMWLAEEPPQFKTAIERGRGWLDTMRPTERSEPIWQELRIELARAYLLGAEAEGATAQDRRGKSEARKLLTAAMRVSGEHQGEASDLLSKLGIERTAEPEQPVEVADVKNFDEAYAAAREQLDQAEAETISLKIIEQELEAGGGNQEQLAGQREQILAEVNKRRAAAAELLRRGLALATPEASVDDVNQARYYLAYVQIKRERYREAAAVGEFLARRFPTSPLALQSGLLAMMAFQGMLADLDDEQEAATLDRLAALASYLAERWPGDPRAAGAGGLLVRIALTQKDFAQAEKSLQAMDDDAAEKAELQRLLGQLQWNEYVTANAAGDEDKAATALAGAIRNLAAGLKGVDKNEVDNSILQAGLVLAKAHLKRDQSDRVLQVLQHPAYGALTQLDEENFSPPDTNFATDAYRIALQAEVARIVEGATSKDALDRAGDMIKKVQESLADQPDGSERLVRMFYGLAGDIRSQLDNATPDRRRQLIGAFRLLLDRLAEQASDVATLHWVAQTFLQMGQAEAGDATPPVTGLANDLLQSAVSVYDRLLSGNQKIDAQARLQMRLEYATAQRLQGEFKAAVDATEKILLEKPAMLDAQLEAALAYHQWGSTGSDKLYLAAILGGRRNEKSGRNTIWGWGKLGSQTNGREEFRDIFFEARYRLAEARYRYAKRQSSEEDQKKYAAMAAKDITGTGTFHPDYGGPEMRRRFDALMRQIQQTLGEAAVGLAAN